jgi:hypothetical protein
MGRAVDRISGAGAAMVPVSDVESELLKTPAVEDVVLVDYLDKEDGELWCVVIVPETEPPIILDELRKYLSDEGMTVWYLPTGWGTSRGCRATATARQSAQGATPALAGGKAPLPMSGGRPHRRDGARRTGQSAPTGWRERLRCGRLPWAC